LYQDKYQKAAFKLKGVWLYICVIVGFVMILFFCFVILIDLKTLFNIGLFVVFVLSGVMYYALRKRYLASQGIHCEAIMQKEDWG